MRIFKYLFGIWTAAAVYAFFSFFSGPRGLPAYNHLLSEREQQWNNIRELGNINEELEKTKNNLLYDYDTLLVHARQLGYGEEDERYIRIVGLGSVKNTPAMTGKVYFTHETGFLSERTIKFTAFFAGLAVFSFLFVLELIERKVH
jgi:cell division protein FtsB